MIGRGGVIWGGGGDCFSGFLRRVFFRSCRVFMISFFFLVTVFLILTECVSVVRRFIISVCVVFFF